MSKIAQLPDDAKIWIYQANRKLTSEDKRSPRRVTATL